MYEYIKGLVAELNPAYAVIEAGGIGYFVNISLTSYSALVQGEQAQLFLHQVKVFVIQIVLIQYLLPCYIKQKPGRFLIILYK